LKVQIKGMQSNRLISNLLKRMDFEQTFCCLKNKLLWGRQSFMRNEEGVVVVGWWWVSNTNFKRLWNP